MIDIQRGKFLYECDGCEEVLETRESDFAMAREKFKEEEWAARLVKGKWEHYCKRCKGAM